MSKERIGTILHGALGDCYEQLCAIKEIRKHNNNSVWIGFFADKRQLKIMQHFELNMLDEVHTADSLTNVGVDRFYQYQIMDCELQENVVSTLPENIKIKFNFKNNLKPWHAIRTHNFRESGLELNLSAIGKEYLPLCLSSNDVDESIFQKRFTVGYLWRHRGAWDAVKPIFQRRPDWILKTKGDLFRKLIEDYNAHIFIAGMKRQDDKAIPNEIKEKCGFLPGEYKSKYTEYDLNLPKDRCTYLKGLGYAEEMEIMAKCNLLLMMPSGFSEALWMKQKVSVVMLDAPPVYLAKLIYNRMPLFNNLSLKYFLFNNMTIHSGENVIKFLKSEKMLKGKNEN